MENKPENRSENKFENKPAKRPQGRPTGSNVRNNIIALLARDGPMHGYEIYQKYIEKYPQVTMRLIYYHLKKGVSLGELRVLKIEMKKGEYSWGTVVQNIIYAIK